MLINHLIEEEIFFIKSNVESTYVANGGSIFFQSRVKQKTNESGKVFQTRYLGNK